MRWFGKAYGAPYEADCEHAETPTGQPCAWCAEAFLATDSGLLLGYIDTDVSPAPRELAYHYLCHLRMIVGGLNHLRGLCTCCGGTLDPDPEGMTRREAACAAIEEWNRRRRA